MTVINAPVCILWAVFLHIVLQQTNSYHVLLYQENVLSLLSVKLLSVIYPTKSGCLYFEKGPLGFRKCTFVHFRLLFVLSVVLKVIGGFSDVLSSSTVVALVWSKSSDTDSNVWYGPSWIIVVIWMAPSYWYPLSIVSWVFSFPCFCLKFSNTQHITMYIDLLLYVFCSLYHIPYGQSPFGSTILIQ